MFIAIIFIIIIFIVRIIVIIVIIIVFIKNNIVHIFVSEKKLSVFAAL